VSLNVKPDVVS